jgi:Tol biopolymer transport system component
VKGRAAAIVLAAGLCGLAISRLQAAPEAAAAPELVGAGTLSTPADEFGAAFTPDGKTVYFTLRSPTTTTPPLTVICVSRFAGGRWGEPEVAPFSGRWNDLTPAISPDGRHLFFASDRPVAGRPKAADGADLDLWVMDRRPDGGWETPRNLGAPVDTPGIEQSPAIAADGTLYFAAVPPEGKGSLDLYQARPEGNGYAAPEPLAGINTDAYEGQPAVAPDQSFLVFASAGRPDALAGGGAPYPRADLYVSFRNGTGWGAPRHLPPPINSTASDSSPSLSPDGRWLYFTSERSPFFVPMPHPLSARELAAGLHGVLNGRGNLYRIELARVRAAELGR